MFTLNPELKKATLDTEIDNILSQMQSYDAHTEEHQTMLEHLERLYKLKTSHKKSFAVSPDAVLAVAGNLAGIALILNYERLGVVTSKALSFVSKVKI